VGKGLKVAMAWVAPENRMHCGGLSRCTSQFSQLLEEVQVGDKIPTFLHHRREAGRHLVSTDACQEERQETAGENLTPRRRENPS
jgi:hypothetical protein